MLVRPLLTIRRDELRTGLNSIGQSWREDASNDDGRFQRNWIRGTLLPLIRERYPHADEAILRTIESQSRLSAKCDHDAKEWLDSHVEYQGDATMVARGEVDIAILSAAVRLLWDRLNWPRQSMNSDHLHRLHAMVIGGVDDAFTLPGDIQCRLIDEKIKLIRGRET